MIYTISKDGYVGVIRCMDDDVWNWNVVLR